MDRSLLRVIQSAVSGDRDSGDLSPLASAVDQTDSVLSQAEIAMAEDEGRRQVRAHISAEVLPALRTPGIDGDVLRMQHIMDLALKKTPEGHHMTSDQFVASARAAFPKSLDPMTAYDRERLADADRPVGADISFGSGSTDAIVDGWKRAAANVNKQRFGSE